MTIKIFDYTDSTGDLRSISEYTPQIEVKQETDKNQLQLF